MEGLLHLFDRPFVLSHTSVREGEQKIGQTIRLIEEEGDLYKEIKASGARAAILFLPEDIGIRANLGRPGASTTWQPALQGICNLQENYFLHGKDILLLGAMNFEDLMEESQQYRADTPEGLSELRRLTEEVDHRVRTIVSQIFKAGVFPILIGGGHNNAFPILAAWCDAHDSVLSAINLDPHADYRAMEGRHSGNGFRYAHEKGALDRYAVVGLHEGYNSEAMFHLLRNDPDLRYSTFENIAVQRILTFKDSVTDSVDFVAEGPFGVELDLDSIPGMPVSASTSTGFSLEDARQYVHLCTSRPESAYLHICEGSAGLASDQQLRELSKAIASLVADAIKAKGNEED